MSVRSLAEAVRIAVEKRVAEESRAKRGVIKGGKFLTGSKAYDFVQAVDCDVSEGKKVWAQVSENGKAVIVGA